MTFNVHFSHVFDSCDHSSLGIEIIGLGVWFARVCCSVLLVSVLSSSAAAWPGEACSVGPVAAVGGIASDDWQWVWWPGYSACGVLMRTVDPQSSIEGSFPPCDAVLARVLAMGVCLSVYVSTCTCMPFLHGIGLNGQT